MKNCVITLLLWLLSSCVGTVEDAADKKTTQSSDAGESFSYAGITEGAAIAHNRFELQFPGMNPTLYDLFLFVDNSSVIIKIDLNDDKLFLRGDDYVYTYIEGGLHNHFNFIGNTHVFKIRAFRKADLKWSENEREVQLTGFNNRVSFFDGPLTIEPYPGAADTKAILKWIAYPMSNQFAADLWDTVYYTITYVPSSEGYAALYDPNYTGSNRFTKRSPNSGLNSPSSLSSSLEIDDFLPDTTYYIGVRGVHKLYNDQVTGGVNPLTASIEQNTRYLTYTTPPATNLFTIDLNALTVANATGQAGLTTIWTSWQSGEGKYTGYRLYYKEYTGVGDPTADDQLDLNAHLIPLGGVCSVAGAIKCTTLTPIEVGKVVSGLTPYTWYQFKLALCNEVTCQLDPLLVVGSNQAAILGNLKSIQVRPTLAPFAGIDRLDSPDNAAFLDRLSVSFTSPTLSVGYADTMELYCVDPSDYTNYVLMPQDGSALAASGIAVCDGLSTTLTTGAALNTLTYATIDDHTKYYVHGAVADAATEYCFVLIDAITGQGVANIERQTITSSSVRCFYPKINTPSVEQFAGLNTCSVTNDSILVNWTLPTGGVYDGFKVYWKAVSGIGFNFPDAIAAVAGYNTHGAPIYLPNNAVNHTITGLTPGTTYEIGVLAWTTSGLVLPSQFNTNIKRCKIAFPIATFSEWSRIFAIGPKVDGRYNKPLAANFYTGYDSSSFIFEALNSDSIPYETDGIAFNAPPGFAPGATFGDPFDGAPNSTGQAMSNSGIVSLAWEEVDLDYHDAVFQAAQDLGARGSRSFGYKVFRSYNNGITWTDLTDDSGLIHASNYTYLPRSNSLGNGSDITKRMAFFTDYSVSSLEGDGQTERGRIVLYKIVPYYNDTAILYQNEVTNRNHIIKLILPPPNMALVHRYMANRTACLELDLTYEPSNKYVCDYNGIGSKPKGLPWLATHLVYDQGGDLLVDRFELGCSYTRGSKVQDPTLGQSFINLGLPPYSLFANNNLESPVRYFNGLNSVDSTFMRGCFHQSDRLRTRVNTIPLAAPPEENDIWYGDCIGNHELDIPYGLENGLGWSLNARFNAPGVPNMDFIDFTPSIAVNTDASNPQVAMGTDVAGGYSFFGSVGDFKRHILTQSEFMGVYYSQSNFATSYVVPVEGPDHLDPTGVSKVNILNVRNSFINDANRYHQSCFINLAAIGADNFWRQRWVSVGMLGDVLYHNGNRDELITKTVDEVVAANNLYNNSAPATSEFKSPDENTFWNNFRFDGDTPLGRIFSSNSAKLPPLLALRSQDYIRLCSTYQVQVGESTNGSNFVARTQVMLKRPLRRAEHLRASQFPETTTYNEIQIQNIEEGDNVAVSNSCASSLNNLADGSNEAVWTNTLNSRSTSSIIQIRPFHTGSGRLDTGGYTESCTSKYGIQDMVGNVRETTTDFINCDYSLDQLYFGEYNILLQTGVPGLSVEIPNVSWDGIEFWEDAQVLDQFGVPIPGIGLARPWAQVASNSGYCSIVDSDEANTDPGNFKTGSTFKSIDELRLVPSPQFIENTFDPMAINTQRNGDATYTAFGLNKLFPELKYANSLAIASGGINTLDVDQAKGNYFSPIVGLPLFCPNAVGSYDPCNIDGGGEGGDNTLVTTTYLNTRNSPLLAAAITDYPTHNSQILSLGIGDTDGGPTTPQSWDPISPGSTQDIVTEVRLTIPSGGNPLATVGDYTLTTLPPSDPSFIGNSNYYDITWVVERNSRMEMTTGGGVNDLYTGRFTMNNTNHNVSNERNGSRCMIFINLDEDRRGVETE